MRHLIALCFTLTLLVVCSSSLSGQIKMGDNPNAIDPASLLELESTDKGFLWPRLTVSQRDNINFPPKGLTIYNVDMNCVEVNVGTKAAPDWLCLSEDSDNQTISDFTLDGNVLTISLEGGNTQTVDLSSIQGQDSDQQQIQDFSLNGPILTITLENGGTQSVDLSSFEGFQGPEGPQGEAGLDGLSAYQVWLGLGNTGTEQDFIDSLRGTDGVVGSDGIDGIGIESTVDNGNGTFTITYTDGSTFTTSDLTGPAGADGIDGTVGSDGLSAYQIWLAEGNVGTEQDFLDSLIGADGQIGADGARGPEGAEGQAGRSIVNTFHNPNGSVTFEYSDGDSYTTPSLTGPRGANGADGANGTDGIGVQSTVDNGDGTFTITYTCLLYTSDAADE